MTTKPKSLKEIKPSLTRSLQPQEKLAELQANQSMGDQEIVPQMPTGTQEKGTGLMPERPFLTVLAEMLFFAERGPGAVPHSGLDVCDETVKDEYRILAKNVLFIIDKLNLMLVPKRDLVSERLSDKQQIMQVITAFMTAMNSPKDLQKTFPIEELAVRIMDGRTV